MEPVLKCTNAWMTMTVYEEQFALIQTEMMETTLFPLLIRRMITYALVLVVIPQLLMTVMALVTKMELIMYVLIPVSVLLPAVEKKPKELFRGPVLLIPTVLMMVFLEVSSVIQTTFDAELKMESLPILAKTLILNVPLMAPLKASLVD